MEVKSENTTVVSSWTEEESHGLVRQERQFPRPFYHPYRRHLSSGHNETPCTATADVSRVVAEDFTVSAVAEDLNLQSVVKEERGLVRQERQFPRSFYHPYRRHLSSGRIETPGTATADVSRVVAKDFSLQRNVVTSVVTENLNLQSVVKEEHGLVRQKRTFLPHKFPRPFYHPYRRHLSSGRNETPCTATADVSRVVAKDFTLQSVVAKDFTPQSVVAKDFSLQSVVAKVFSLQSVVTEDLNLQSVETEDLNLQSVVAEDLNLQSVVKEERGLVRQKRQFPRPFYHPYRRHLSSGRNETPGTATADVSRVVAENFTLQSVVAKDFSLQSVVGGKEDHGAWRQKREFHRPFYHPYRRHLSSGVYETPCTATADVLRVVAKYFTPQSVVAKDFTPQSVVAKDFSLQSVVTEDLNLQSVVKEERGLVRQKKQFPRPFYHPYRRHLSSGRNEIPGTATADVSRVVAEDFTLQSVVAEDLYLQSVVKQELTLQSVVKDKLTLQSVLEEDLYLSDSDDEGTRNVDTDDKGTINIYSDHKGNI